MKIYGHQITLDAQTLEAVSNALAVKLVSDSALESTASGIQVKSLGITNEMLTGSIAFTKLADSDNIARLDQTETIAAIWDFGSNIPTITLDPTTANQVVRKAYVDALYQGQKPKADSILCATTANITLSGEQTIDGITTSSSRVLVKNQTNAYENGIYVSGSGSWTRSTDADSWDELVSAFVIVSEGTTYADTRWLCTADAGGTLETSAINFMDLTSTTYSAGVGLDLSGSQFYLVPAALISGGVAEIDGDQIDIDWVPTNSTPDTSPDEVSSTNHLSAVLQGLDNAIGAAAGAPTVEMHAITSGEVTNGYFTLSGIPLSASSVHVEKVGGIKQINKAWIGSTGVTADYEILNSTQLHINNNGEGSSLSAELLEGQVLIITYWV